MGAAVPSSDDQFAEQPRLTLPARDEGVSAEQPRPAAPAEGGAEVPRRRNGPFRLGAPFAAGTLFGGIVESLIRVYLFGLFDRKFGPSGQVEADTYGYSVIAFVGSAIFIFGLYAQATAFGWKGPPRAFRSFYAGAIYILGLSALNAPRDVAWAYMLSMPLHCAIVLGVQAQASARRAAQDRK